jgi:hypothetical protein
VDDALTPRLARVKSRISPESWQRRVKQAQRDEAEILRILQRVDRGASLNEALAQVLSASRRGRGLRRVARYRAEGLVSLIDARLPREPELSVEWRRALQAARMANPRLGTEEVLSILGAQGMPWLPSESTIRREFARVDWRRRYAERRRAAEGTTVIDLPFAGAELLAAAEAESGGICEQDIQRQVASQEPVAGACRMLGHDLRERDGQRRARCLSADTPRGGRIQARKIQRSGRKNHRSRP